MTMDRLCRIVTFKGQDPGNGTRKKKKKKVAKTKKGNQWEISLKLSKRAFLKMKAIGKTECHRKVTK